MQDKGTWSASLYRTQRAHTRNIDDSFAVAVLANVGFWHHPSCVDELCLTCTNKYCHRKKLQLPIQATGHCFVNELKSDLRHHTGDHHEITLQRV